MADLTTDEARTKVELVKALVGTVWTEVADLYHGRAWLALGYGSWDGLCVAEFDGARIRLPREDRREIVGSLREAGLSNRAIAAATGVDESTVRDDLRGAGNPAPAEVSGTDGKRYPAARPVSARPAAEDYRERYPTINRPTVPDAKAVEYGTYLDGLPEFERTERVTNLERTLDRRDAGIKAPAIVVPESVPAFHRLGEAITDVASRLSRYRGSLPDVLAEAQHHVDPREWDLVCAAAVDLRNLLGPFCAPATPTLRSVK
jgi:hypothetical protein